MIELVIGSIITLASLLIGYTLGKHQSVVSPDVKKQINQIFRKVVPNADIGPVVRPNAKDNYLRDNPQYAQEQDIMNSEFDNLNNNVQS